MHVYAGEPIEPEDIEQRLFVARYLLKCPVSLKRMQLIEEPLGTTVRYLREADDGNDFCDFSPLAFLAELQQHIPNTWEQLIHFYGLYSARTRGVQREQQARLSAADKAGDKQESPQEKPKEKFGRTP